MPAASKAATRGEASRKPIEPEGREHRQTQDAEQRESRRHPNEVEARQPVDGRPQPDRRTGRQPQGQNREQRVEQAHIPASNVAPCPRLVAPAHETAAEAERRAPDESRPARHPTAAGRRRVRCLERRGSSSLRFAIGSDRPPSRKREQPTRRPISPPTRAPTGSRPIRTARAPVDRRVSSAGGPRRQGSTADTRGTDKPMPRR